MTLQTITTYLKWDKKEKITQFRCMYDTIHYSECQIVALIYAQIYSNSKSYYLFVRDTIFDVILMADVSITFLSLSKQVLDWEQS